MPLLRFCRCRDGLLRDGHWVQRRLNFEGGLEISVWVSNACPTQSAVRTGRAAGLAKATATYQIRWGWCPGLRSVAGEVMSHMIMADFCPG